MDISKITIDEIRQFGPERMKEVEIDIRKELVNLKMDLYTSASVDSGKALKLRKTLARINTVRAENKK